MIPLLCIQFGLIMSLQFTRCDYHLRFFSNLLIQIVSLSNSHNNVTSSQKNRDDKSLRVTVALIMSLPARTMDKTTAKNRLWVLGSNQ